MSMPVAWQAGYDWALGKGPFANLGCNEAAEAHGYDLMDEESSELWNRGVEAAQDEQS